MIYFNSDYLEGAHPEIMKRLAETNMVQTVGYGEDEYCASARARIRAACDAPDADIHFFSGGTQANTTVIAAILRPWQGVLSAASGHINCHEAGAIEATGHKVIALPTDDGKITARQIEDYVHWHRTDPSSDFIVQPGMVYISHPTECGTLYTKSELTAIYDACQRCGLRLFIDGARLGYGLMTDGTDVTLLGARRRDALRRALLRELGHDAGERRRPPCRRTGAQKVSVPCKKGHPTAPDALFLKNSAKTAWVFRVFRVSIG